MIVRESDRININRYIFIPLGLGRVKTLPYIAVSKQSAKLQFLLTEMDI